MAADGIANWVRLHTLLKVVVWTCAFMALIGVLESFLKYDLTTYLNVPGLVEKSHPLQFEERGSVFRVASTTVHYIELSATLALAQPFAIHFALFARSKWGRRAALVAALVLAAGNAVTQSRTGIVAMVLMFAVLFPIWTWRSRYNIMVVTLAAMAAFVVLVPGTSRTWLRLFTNLDDPGPDRPVHVGLALLHPDPMAGPGNRHLARPAVPDHGQPVDRDRGGRRRAGGVHAPRSVRHRNRVGQQGDASLDHPC
jgi:hypothetical protein